MDALVQELDLKLRQWQPAIAEQVRQRLAEIIELADQDALDIFRSRAVEQDVLDLTDKSKTRLFVYRILSIALWKPTLY